MQDTLGPEGYRTAFLENLSKVMAEDSLDLNVQEVPIIKAVSYTHLDVYKRQLSSSPLFTTLPPP